MRAQAIDSLAAWPADIRPPSGVLVLSGYGLDVRVWRGRLRVADGIGRDRRVALVHRATGRLKRLVVLGHSGSVSLESIRWLADVGAGYLQIDADGRVLAAFGPQGADRPALRRAQARALDTDVGDGIARRLIAEKVAAQAETLAAVDRVAPVADDTIATLRVVSDSIHDREGRDDLRLAEAVAASAYWSAWSPVPLAFARRDLERVPAHWRSFGSRTSPLTGGPRLAANPANAILNYLYALLEGEATIAARVVGLDPGLGVMHADQLNRASLAADLMEPVRPKVDRDVLDLLTSRSFALADFHETRQGVCRVTPMLASELALTGPRWARAVGRVAEDVARLLDDRASSDRPVPTPVSGRNRAAGRPGRARGESPEPRGPNGVRQRCTWCGESVTGTRRTCSAECEAQVRASQDTAAFQTAGLDRMRAMRAAGVEPVGEAARARISTRQRERQAEENAWNAAHSERPEPDVFRREVLPTIQDVSLRELARRTGLSVAYCARIRRGVEVPHARWWGRLVDPSATPSSRS